MALDVRLSRDVDEPWGFELFGGADDEMPLTIEKIEPDSPAKRAGLLTGDTILTINGEEAIDLSLDAACRKVEKCGHSLTVGVLRGLYDPVLDDHEPIFDYELEDLGRQSEPTEVVFEIQKFVEPLDIGSKLLEYDARADTLIESRSLTASPFVTPTKPYRPFSTEPVVEIPPLEDPIILNPNYRDQFGKSPIDSDPDYLLSAHCKNGLGVEGKYKLPISEQYDPDGKRFKQNIEVVEKLLKYEKHVKSLSKDLEVVDVTKETKVCDTVTKDVKTKQSLTEDIKTEKKGVQFSEEISKHEESIRKDSRSMEKKETYKEEVDEESIREELQHIEKMRQEIDLEKIEETAQTIVEESIERAISVAEEIKKEMEVELSPSEVEERSEKTVESERVEESGESIDKSQAQKEVKEYVERKMSKEEIIEIHEASQVAQKDYKESEISEQYSKDGKVQRQSLVSEQYQHEEVKEEPRKKQSSAQESLEDKFERVTKTVTSDKKEAERRAYTIGLQTIPNVRGVVHSSYHYDLLLSTFFLHLTDVMVALSRFLLTQPIFNQLAGTQETRTYESGERDLKVRKSSQEVHEKVEKRGQEMKVVESKQQGRELVTPAPVQEMKKVSQKIEKDMKVESVQGKKVERKETVKLVPVKKDFRQEQRIEREEMAVEKKLSGAQMAQRSEKKLSKDLTEKMDAVISEFQTVTEEDVKTNILQRSSRSRSRSQIEEEVMKESDPLEWLSKKDSRRTSQEITEMSKQEFESTTKAQKSFVETKQEPIHKKSKTPKQTYIAIVESHVYTNKDAIFEEYVTDISETSSVQSAEEIHTAVEAIETISTENVALEKAIQELETAKIIKESHQLATVKAESTATVQKIDEVMHDSKEFVQEEIKKQTAIQSSDIQEVLIQDTREIVEPLVEIKEDKIERVEKVAFDINESLSVAESSEINFEETKSEFADVEIKKETVDIVDEEKATEKAVESKPEVIEPKPIEVVEISEIVKLRPLRERTPIQDEYAALKIVKKVEIDTNLSPEIIEVEDISELYSKSVINKVGIGNELEVDTSKQVSKSSVSTEIGVAKSEVQRKSVVDVSEVSEISSQGGLSSVKKELDVSQTVASESTISEAKSQQNESASKISQAASQQSKLAVSQKLESESEMSQSLSQEAAFKAKSVDRKLSLRTDLDRQMSGQSPPSSIDTPTPSTVPPTPLTDEYIFKLSLPLPKSRSGTPIPRDSTLSPEEEDPQIVKKKLIPHIETTIERVVYDPPLATPPADKPQSPVYLKPVSNGGAVKPFYSKPGLKGGAGKVRYLVYRKPGLFGGADRPEYSKEEIREIERKSSLLASAIDETIKSIEEYKEEVGIDTKKELKMEEFKEEEVAKTYQESYKKETRKGSITNGFEETDTKIEEIIEKCNALAASENIKANNNNIEESEARGIVTEVPEEEIKKEIIIKPTLIDSEPKIENEATPAREKTVKFKNKVKIVEVEQISDKVVEIETKQTLPEIMPPEPKTAIVKPAVKIEHNEDVQIPIQATIVPETAVESKVEAAVKEDTEKSDSLLGFRPVAFDPENNQRPDGQYVMMQEQSGTRDPRLSPYQTETGEPIGTIKGIVDGLEEPVMDEEVAKVLGKPGISEEKIATLISGEAEMLREAHVMGLARVLTSHMHRVDDSSVDFQKIKPMIDSLKDSDVIKALNEELERQKAEEKKKQEKKWTTFLQKPKRPVPKAKFGYRGWTKDEEQVVTEPYKVKIVKQAKPKVAPDYKPEDFETGPLPWEESALADSSLPPIEPEEPILIPEVPEFLEAVDPLTESEVPDLEDTGIPLPPPKEPTPPPIIEEQPPEPEPVIEEAQEEDVPQTEEKQETGEDMENRLAEQLVRSVQGMVDPNASLEQQLNQMRAQVAALSQLPQVIQQSLELVSKQLSKMKHPEAQVETSETLDETQQHQEVAEVENHNEMETIKEANENTEAYQNETEKMTIEDVSEKMEMGQQNMQQQQNMTPVIAEEDMRNEKQRKEQARLEFESRQVKDHPTPRATKPKRMFGPLDPDEARAVVLPGGRRWRNTQDVYDEQRIAEIMQAHSELLNGKTLGKFESDLLPYDNRINFMKYEKPPVSLDHLKHSEVFKLVHDMDQAPPTRMEMRTPVMSEAEYRERCRSMTPSVMEKKHLQIPQQFHP